MKKSGLFSLIFAAFSLFSCGGSTSSSISTSIEDLNATHTYAIKLHDVGEVYLSGVEVTLDDGTNTYTEESDDIGIASFDGLLNKVYTVTFNKLPAGYSYSGDIKTELGVYSYTFEANVGIEQNKTLSASHKFTVGEVAYDFELPNQDSVKVKLSDLWKTKKVVILNFYYTTCYYCNLEFPDLEEVYEEYSSDIAIMAIDDVDALSTIKEYSEEKSLTFDCFRDNNSNVTKHYLQGGYPTTVLIDKYGYVCKYQTGAMSSKNGFINFFKNYLKDDYKPNFSKN